MEFSIMLKILIAAVAGVYLLSLLMVLIYERRKMSLYKKAKKEIILIENLGISMAVLHAKMFRVRHDYLKMVGDIDRKQQFIFEKILLIRRSTFKTKYKNNCPAFLL
jgi:uncharacterized membrane protein